MRWKATFLPCLSPFDDLSLMGLARTGEEPQSPTESPVNLLGRIAVFVSGFSRYQTSVEFHPDWLS
jgi:hypothetical protein